MSFSKMQTQHHSPSPPLKSRKEKYSRTQKAQRQDRGRKHLKGKLMLKIRINAYHPLEEIIFQPK